MTDREDIIGPYLLQIASLEKELADQKMKVRQLVEERDTPHTVDFMAAVALEAAHQRERWAASHDAGKTDADWFWLIGYLAGKALHAAKDAAHADAGSRDQYLAKDKRLHHIITTAAACLNWHAGKVGADTRMRPGIDPAGAQ